MTAIEKRLELLESKSTKSRYQIFNSKGKVVEELPPGAQVETVSVLHIYDDRELSAGAFFRAALVIFHDYVESGGENEQN